MSHEKPEDLGLAFARLKDSLRGYLRRHVRAPSDADDLLQDIFVKALAAERAGQTIGNLPGWLYRTARTTLVDYYRKTGRPLQDLSEDIPQGEVEDLSLHAELSECLRPFVDTLAPIYRDTLVAADLDGETMRAIADRESVSVSAVKSRAARARAMLKDKVLACCAVEMTDGVVSDYVRHSPSGCGGKCT